MSIIINVPTTVSGSNKHTPIPTPEEHTGAGCSMNPGLATILIWPLDRMPLKREWRRATHHNRLRHGSVQKQRLAQTRSAQDILSAHGTVWR